jgi:hypothetical protein
MIKDEELVPHLKVGLFHWQEAIAIDAYFRRYGVVPPLNVDRSSIVFD